MGCVKEMILILFYDFLWLLSMWVLFDFDIFFLVAEIDCFEESVCRYNPEHCERGGGAYFGVGEKGSPVSERALFRQRRGGSDASQAQTDVGF